MAHQDDLAVRLDLAGVLHHFEAVVNFIPEALHLNHAHRPDAINGDPRVAAAPLANHRVQLGRPGSRVVSLPPAGNEIEHVGRAADLVDCGKSRVNQVAASAEFEESDRTFGRHVEVSRLVVGTPDLHIGCICGVADVHRVVEDDARETAGRQGLAHPREPVAADLVEIARRDGVLHRTVLARGIGAVGAVSHGAIPIGTGKRDWSVLRSGPRCVRSSIDVATACPLLSIDVPFPPI